MRASERRLNLVVMVLAPFAVIVFAAILLPALNYTSNCGGNSAALSACKSTYTIFYLASHERGMKPVSIKDLSPAEREYFKQLSGQSWLGDAKILVTIKPVQLSQNTEKEILAVCDRAFDNVPRRRIGKAPLTHAAVYTDGSTDLLSQDEFKKLNLETFVNTRELAEAVTDQ